MARLFSDLGAGIPSALGTRPWCHAWQSRTVAQSDLGGLYWVNRSNSAKGLTRPAIGLELLSRCSESWSSNVVEIRRKMRRRAAAQSAISRAIANKAGTPT